MMKIIIITITTYVVFIMIIACIIYIANSEKCKRCGKRSRGIQIEFGFYRKYKCPKCGTIIKEESGLDY